MIDKESLHLFCTDAHYTWKSKSPIGLGIVEGTGGHPRVLEVRKGDCALKSQARVLLRVAVEPAHHLVRAVALPSGGSIRILINLQSCSTLFLVVTMNVLWSTSGPTIHPSGPWPAFLWSQYIVTDFIGIRSWQDKGLNHTGEKPPPRSGGKPPGPCRLLRSSTICSIKIRMRLHLWVIVILQTLQFRRKKYNKEDLSPSSQTWRINLSPWVLCRQCVRSHHRP